MKLVKIFFTQRINYARIDCIKIIRDDIMMTITVDHNKEQLSNEHNYLKSVAWAILDMGISLAIRIILDLYWTYRTVVFFRYHDKTTGISEASVWAYSKACDHGSKNVRNSSFLKTTFHKKLYSGCFLLASIIFFFFLLLDTLRYFLLQSCLLITQYTIITFISMTICYY
jgi:hypothetical protein